MATHSSILAWEIPWTEKPVQGIAESRKDQAQMQGLYISQSDVIHKQKHMTVQGNLKG